MVDKNDVIKFMKHKGIQFDPCVTSWVIEADPGLWVDIVELLMEYGEQKFKEGLDAENDDL